MLYDVPPVPVPGLAGVWLITASAPTLTPAAWRVLTMAANDRSNMVAGTGRVWWLGPTAKRAPVFAFEIWHQVAREAVAL